MLIRGWRCRFGDGGVWVWFDPRREQLLLVNSPDPRLEMHGITWEDGAPPPTPDIEQLPLIS